MRKFAIVREDEAPARTSEIPALGRPEGPWTTSVLQYFPSQGETLELKRVTLAPHTVVAPHRHNNAEIVYVLEGTITFGAQTCGPGASVFVAADSRYGFTAGPEGCTFLNFRGDLDTTVEYATAPRRAGAGQ